MKRINQALKTLALSTGLFLISPVSTFAASNLDISLNTGIGEIGGPLSKISFANLVSGGIRFILVIAALLFFFMLVIGGIQWIISGGDKAASENARKRITSALVGLAIVFAAWAIATLVNTLFGVDIFKLSITPLTAQ